MKIIGRYSVIPLVVLCLCLISPSPTHGFPGGKCGKIISALLGVAAVGYLGINGYMYFQQRDFIYMREAETLEHREMARRYGFIEWIDSSGKKIGYIRLADRDTSPRAVIVFFRGNGGLGIDHSDWLSDLFPNRDTIIALPEYPGSGNTLGIPTEATLFAAGENAIREVKLRWPHNPVRVMGWSIGASVALHTATRTNVQRLALISPFYSLEEEAARNYPYLLTGLLLQDRYRNYEMAPQVGVPTAIIHGGRDRNISAEAARRLHGLFPPNIASFHLIRDAGHSSLLGEIPRNDEAAEFRLFLQRDD